MLHQVLFAEESIKLVKDAFDTRMEDRREILEARRAAEVAEHEAKEQAKYDSQD